MDDRLSIEPRTESPHQMQAQFHAQAAAYDLALSTQARNLQFLALIESTIDRVSSDIEHVRVCTSSILKCEEELRNAFGKTSIPQEHRLVELMEKILEVARRLHAEAKKAHRSACDDRMLKPDDGVADVFEGMIDATQGLFAVAADFKDWLETHNALLEPSTGKTYQSVDDLLADLDAS